MYSQITPFRFKPKAGLMGTYNFDQVIHRVFKATGIESQTELAKILQVNRSAVTQARKKGSVPDRWLLLLFREYGLSPEWLETGVGRVFLKQFPKDESTFKKIPKVKARICAGSGSLETDGAIQGYYSFRIDWLKRKGSADKMVLMDIFGNSMEPEIKDGDSVLVDQSQKNVLAGALYAVGIEDTIMVKRIEKRPNQLVLLSNHKDYEPIYLTGDDADKVRIIGKVVWCCRDIR
jgi:phage repressor protein C with HTH and peptisase S24 domain